MPAGVSEEEVPGRRHEERGDPGGQEETEVLGTFESRDERDLPIADNAATYLGVGHDVPSPFDHSNLPDTINHATMVAQKRRCEWVLLSYRIPREPSTPRIAVWRKLKRLGVAQIGEGLAGLPADARTLEQLEWLAEEIDDAGGSSTLWRAELTSAAQERGLVAEMAAARAAEYAAIADRAREAQPSIGTADSIRMVRSLRRALRQVQRRDFFPPPERDTARAEVAVLARVVLDQPAADVPGLAVES